MSSPAVAATSPESKGGHPPGLYMLFFAELWERFCYYGMRALLAVYVAQLFMVAKKDAALIYGAYTSLVYAVGIFGGYVADKVLGYRRSILLGGTIMAAGCFTLTVKDQSAFLWGLSLIVVGNGLFKPNISTLVGKLYGPNDPRRDGGFTIFYMGINIGAALAPVLCAWISNVFPIEVAREALPPGYEPKPEQILPSGLVLLPDYRWGFGMAGAGMLLGILTFRFFQRGLGDKGLTPENRQGAKWLLCVLAGCAVTAPCVHFLLSRKDIGGYILLILAIGMLLWFVSLGIKMSAAGDRAGGQRMYAFLLLLFANMIFWACFEQAGNSLNFFARDHVSNPGWWDFEYFQSVNAVYIILLGPVFAWLWVKLAAQDRNPSIPRKFGLGLVQVGLGFVVCNLAISMAGPEFRTPFLMLFLVYLFHTTGELCISPVGLSMVTKLAPSHMTGVAMGAWFLSISCGNYLAGVISAIAGGALDEDKLDKGQIVGADALAAYSSTYAGIAWFAIVAGALYLLLAKPMNRLMHGIK
ncbi:MAG: peptide MFS transporter [Planctomycetes bacterium]|nr:peptide MFS transporter [Planctomycetota bacterium]